MCCFLSRAFCIVIGRGRETSFGVSSFGGARIPSCAVTYCARGVGGASQQAVPDSFCGSYVRMTCLMLRVLCTLTGGGGAREPSLVVCEDSVARRQLLCRGGGGGAVTTMVFRMRYGHVFDDVLMALHVVRKHCLVQAPGPGVTGVDTQCACGRGGGGHHTGYSFTQR